MRMTKKPMMAKRATKAAPAKKTMAAKKPMTVAGKTVKKYQVGGPAMGTMPKGMAGTLGSPRAKPTTTVTPVKTPPKTGGMLQQGGPRGVGGVQPPRFTNYGPGSGQFQQEAPPAYQYNPQTSGRSDPRAIAARQEQERQRIMQEQMMQGGGLGGGMPPNQRPPAQVIGGPRPPMPPKQGGPYGTGMMDPRVKEAMYAQQFKGQQPVQGGGLYGGMPVGGQRPPMMVQAGQGGLFGQPTGTPDLQGRGSVSPQEFQALQDARRQDMLSRGMSPERVQAEMARTTGVIGTPAPGQAMVQQGMTPQQLQQLQQQMAQNARGMGMGLPGGTQQPRQIQAQLGNPEMQQEWMGARQFRKGGAVAKKKKAAATTRGRMAKPARKR